MSYAIVKFPDEETFSEVPTNWLEGTDKCWWPCTKTVTALISKRTSPNKEDGKWKLHPVQIVVDECDNYETARKRADHSTTSSASDDDNKGRGKRKKKAKRVMAPSDSTSSDDEIINDKVLKDIPELVEFEDDPVQPTSEMSEDANNNTEIPRAADPQDENYNNAVIIPFPEEPDEQNLPPINRAANALNVATENQMEELKQFVKDEFLKTQKMVASLKIMIDKLSNEISNNRNIISDNNDEDLLKIKNEFPIGNIGVLEEVEAQLKENKPCYNNVVSYLRTIGGASTKDKVLRIFRKIFTNRLVAQASWLGQSRGERHNYKMANLMIISACRDAISSTSDYTEKVFEDAASDWVRQGKQRHQRELAKNNEDNPRVN